MKILIATGPFIVGGGQMMIKNLIRRLQGDEIYVVCFDKRAKTQLSADVESLCGENIFYVEGNHLQRYVKFSRIIRKVKPDVIHAHLGGNQYSSLWILFHRGHLISTMHTTPNRAYSPLTEKIIRKLLKKKKCTCVAVSEKNYQASQEYFSIYDDRIVFVNNGVETETYYCEEHENTTFINVATHNENKNQKAILYAFQRYQEEYPSSRLILAGDGECHEALKKLSKELEIEDKVHFPGSVTDPEKYYAISDVYVQSSHREGMPLSVLEAMSAKLPVISTDVGGMRDIVKDNGILVSDNDVDALYQAMRDVLADKERYESMREKSFLIAQQCSAAEMAKRYRELYQVRMLIWK